MYLLSKLFTWILLISNVSTQFIFKSFEILRRKKMYFNKRLILVAKALLV